MKYRFNYFTIALQNVASNVFIFSGERKKYYKHQKKAEKNPEKYLSIIIDGMDQSKTHLPHWIQCSKVSTV